MRRRRDSRGLLRKLLIFACGALFSMVLCFAFFIACASERPAAETIGETTALEVREQPVKPVLAGTYMPLYMQTDPQWAHVEYAGGTIGDSGCGLACAAMAVKCMTTQEVTPLTLADAVGASCLTGNVNDPSKFAAWIVGTYADYGIEATPKMYLLDSALDRVSSGWLCFAGLEGAMGDSDYSGHVVLIWRSDDSGYWVRDPASAANSARPFSKEELNAVDFRYFVCVRGGHYGNAGN